MHTFNETAAGVPAFLAKLWRLVEDVDTNELIYWQSDGRSFIIQNQAQFARELLPLNYKHNNMASFIRQLNMYGFHKITSIDNGGLKFDKDEMEFSHPCFQKEQPYLLEHIKRKIANPKQPAQSVAEDKMTLKPETVYKVMNEVKVMRSRQETLDSRFAAMKQENEALWREIAILRQKHVKQQQIVNKLISFLMTLVQPTRGGGGINNMNGVKRRFQLMINDVPDSVKKRKPSEDSNPVIQEFTEDLLDVESFDYQDDVVDDEDNCEPQPQVMSPEVQSNHENEQEDISSPRNFKIERNSTIVDNPDSDNDEDHYHSNNQGHVGDNIDYIMSNIAPESKSNKFSAPSDDWLENNVLSPEMIKQEPITIESVIGGYDYTTGSTQHQMPFTPMINRRLRTSTNKSLLARKKVAQPMHLNIANKGQHAIPSVAKLIRGKPATTASCTSGGKTVSQDAGKPGTSSSNAPTTSALTIPAVKKTPTKVYTNKSDFISTEIPNELFESQDGSVSPLMADFLTGSQNPTLSEDLVTKMGAAPSGSGYNAVDNTNSTNYAITKYNKFGKKDEMSRSASEVNLQLESMQGDIESIKELLKCDDYPLETNSLLNNSSGGLTGKNRLVLSPSVDSELFSKIFGDLDSPFGLSLNSDFNMDKRNDDASGSELMTYQPYNNVDISDFLNSSNSADKNVDDDDEHLPQELNTPCIDRKNLSFLTD